VSDTDQQTADAIVAALDAHPYDPPPLSALRDQGLTTPLLRLLVEQKRVVRLGNDVLVSATAYARAAEQVAAHLAEHEQATVAQLRDHLGATRRLVVPLLEHLDATRVTVRDGDLRRLRTRRPAGTTPA
jgi:selenocysteine-specific elongation factor